MTRCDALLVEAFGNLGMEDLNGSESKPHINTIGKMPGRNVVIACAKGGLFLQMFERAVAKPCDEGSLEKTITFLNGAGEYSQLSVCSSAFFEGKWTKAMQNCGAEAFSSIYNQIFKEVQTFNDTVSASSETIVAYIAELTGPNVTYYVNLGMQECTTSLSCIPSKLLHNCTTLLACWDKWPEVAARLNACFASAQSEEDEQSGSRWGLWTSLGIAATTTLMGLGVGYCAWKNRRSPKNPKSGDMLA